MKRARKKAADQSATDNCIEQKLNTEEQQLLPRHLEGDPSAFSELIDQFGSRIQAYLIRSGVHQSTRDDVFQEVFLKVHKMAHTYQSDRALEPWLFTIAANTARSHFRKQTVRNRLRRWKEVPEGVSRETAEDRANASEVSEWLEVELEKLNFTQRQTIVLCSLHHYSQKDAAEILGLPLNTLKTNLRRARLQLSAALERKKKQEDSEVLV